MSEDTKELRIDRIYSELNLYGNATDRLYFPRTIDGTNLAALQAIEAAIAAHKEKNNGVWFRHMGTDKNGCWVGTSYDKITQYVLFLEGAGLSPYSRDYDMLCEWADMESSEK